jgi:mRNA interferase MazF
VVEDRTDTDTEESGTGSFGKSGNGASDQTEVSGQPRIRQGEVYWVEMGDPIGSGPGYPRPFVVVQNDALNRSRMDTVIVCAISSNPRHTRYSGNVALRVGEAGLPRPSVVNVTQVYTIDRSELGEWMGRLSAHRVREVYAGLRLILSPRDA